MQIIRLDTHTEQNPHDRQSTIKNLAALGPLCSMEWTSRFRALPKPALPHGSRSLEPST